MVTDTVLQWVARASDETLRAKVAEYALSDAGSWSGRDNEARGRLASLINAELARRMYPSTSAASNENGEKS